MMNLLARILSHGFAFAVVALIVIVLMYRGEFPAWETPEFLAIDDQPEAAEESDSGAVDRIPDAAKQPPVSSMLTPGTPEESPTPEAGGQIHPGGGMPAAESVTSPAMDEEPSAEKTEVDAPGAATDSTPGETDMPSIPAPAISEESTVQTSDDKTAPSGDESADEGSKPVESTPQSATTVDSSDDVAIQAPDAATTNLATDETGTMATAEPATTDSDDSDENVDQASSDTSVTTDDLAVVETTVTVVETTSVTVIEEAAPAEGMPAATDGVSTATDTEPATEAPAVPPPDASVQEKPYEVMARAREAFWLRDFELAEQQYRKLTQLEPDNPDGFGELGNMYFSQGKWEDSAAAYYEAGVRLLNEGLVVQARQLVDVIRGLNSPRADDLETQIDAAEFASSP